MSYWAALRVYILTINVCTELASVPLHVGAASIIAFVGDRVVIECHTNLPYGVVWSYKTSPLDRTARDIVLGDEVINGNVKYFDLIQTKIGDYNLVIRNATSNNSGLYSCIEDDGLGTAHNTLLTVMCELF